tara:strand:+ start:1189 stop:2895 length:1707 start_codon:yes stop_codon:yes gene_type:complete
METLSAYELKRRETMRQNAIKLKCLMGDGTSTSMFVSEVSVEKGRLKTEARKHGHARNARRVSVSSTSRSVHLVASRKRVLESDEEDDADSRRFDPSSAACRVSLRVRVDKKMYYYPADSECPTSAEVQAANPSAKAASHSVPPTRRKPRTILDDEEACAEERGTQGGHDWQHERGRKPSERGEEDEREGLAEGEGIGNTHRKKRNRIANFEEFSYTRSEVREDANPVSDAESDVDWLNEFDDSASESYDDSLPMEDDGVAEAMIAMAGGASGILALDGSAQVRTMSATCKPLSPLHPVCGNSGELLTRPFLYASRVPTVPFATQELLSSLPQTDASVANFVNAKVEAMGAPLAGTFLVCVSSRSTQVFYPTPCPLYVQDFQTGTVVRVSSDLTCVTGVDVSQLHAHTIGTSRGDAQTPFETATVVVAQVRTPLLSFRFQDESYAMTYHQVYHRYVYPKRIEGSTAAPELVVNNAPTSFVGKVDCFLIDSHGRLKENAFKKKLAAFGRMSIGHMQFNTAKARRTEDGCHLRFEYIVDGLCLAYIMYPIKMANSYHKVSKDTKTMRVSV